MMLTQTQLQCYTHPVNMAGESTPEQQHTEDIARLEQAWEWLCQRRKTAPDNADIWDLRFHWATQKSHILTQLQAGTYRLTPMQVVGKNRHVMWSAKDALALKWCALALQQTLPLHASCEHVKGHGGGKTSIQKRHRDITQNQYPWVCRTDIKGYYGNINKTRLLQQLGQHVPRQAYLNLLTQYVHYSVEDGGEFYTPEQGIARGCALSPLLGAFHLWALDNHFASQKKISYARYMDDFIIMAKTRWSLRHQVKRLNQFFNEYGFKQHPDKTFIGKVEKGFDWLGGQFGAQGLEGISARSQANHVERLRQLYEQTRHWGKDKQQARVAKYRRRWKTLAFFFLCVCATRPAIGAPFAITDATPDSTTSGTTSSTVHSNYPPAGGGTYGLGSTVSADACFNTLPARGPYNTGCPTSSVISYRSAPYVTSWGATIPAASLITSFPSGNGTTSYGYVTNPSISYAWGFQYPGEAANKEQNFLAGAHLLASTWTLSDGVSSSGPLGPVPPGVRIQHVNNSGSNLIWTGLSAYTTTQVPYVLVLHPNASGGPHTVPPIYINTYRRISTITDGGTVTFARICTVPAVDNVTYPTADPRAATGLRQAYSYTVTCSPGYEALPDAADFQARFTTTDVGGWGFSLKDSTNTAIGSVQPQITGGNCGTSVVNQNINAPISISGKNLVVSGDYVLCNITTTVTGQVSGSGLLTYTWK